MLDTWFPDSDILFGYLIFMIARFENQRWVRARHKGMTGSSALSGSIVDLIGFIALIFTFLFIAAIIFDLGWKIGFTLFFSGIILSIVYSIVSVLILGRESVILWLIGTVSAPLIIFFLFNKVTWFGWT